MTSLQSVLSLIIKFFNDLHYIGFTYIKNRLTTKQKKLLKIQQQFHTCNFHIILFLIDKDKNIHTLSNVNIIDGLTIQMNSTLIIVIYNYNHLCVSRQKTRKKVFSLTFSILVRLVFYLIEILFC